MGLKELVDYIQQYSTQGYSIASIRANLINSGYSPQEVDAAVEKAFHPGREIPWKIILFILAGVLLLVILIYGMVSFLGPSPLSLGLIIDKAPMQIVQGEPLVLSRTITTGIDEPLMVTLSTTIVHDASRERVLSKKEEINVKKINKKNQRYTLPAKARGGEYILTLEIKADGKKTSAVHTFILRTVEDIKRGPSIIPIGGSGSETGICSPTCNDYDPCTLDKCVGGSCVFDAKKPCCGNFECEVGETEQTCAQDCKIRPLTQGEAIMEIRSRAEDLAVSNTGDAVSLCKSIAVSAQADSCLKNVAVDSERSDICKNIAGVKLRDACYLDFVLKNKQGGVCDQIQDRWMRQSCTVFARG